MSYKNHELYKKANKTNKVKRIVENLQKLGIKATLCSRPKMVIFQQK